MPRKQHNIHYIYKTTCNVTGKYYIGMHSTSNIDDGYLGSGKRLRRSIRKYGEENHTKEILEFFETREELIIKEREIVNLDLISKKECLNLVIGGEGGCFITKEQQLINGSKSGNIHKERLSKDIEYLTWFSDLSSNRIKKTISEGKLNHDRKTFLGKKHSEETKQKMSESSKGIGTGESNSQYGTCWITKDTVNKKIKKEELSSYISSGWIKGRV